MDRGAQLAKFHRLLNTSDGKEFVSDCKVAWGTANVFNSDPLAMAYNAGLLEVFRVIEGYQQAEDLQNG